MMTMIMKLFPRIAVTMTWFHLLLLATIVSSIVSNTLFVAAASSTEYQHTTPPTPHRRRRRPLPDKVLIGYASHCDDMVTTAVQDGVNVVIWAFVNLQKHSKTETNDDNDITGHLDLECIRTKIQELDDLGYSDTVHLASMGGWDGPHLDPYYKTAKEWFEAWKVLVGGSDAIFHGLDIDFEGHNDLTSNDNYFPIDEQLDKMGEIMKLAKEDGYIVSIVPAQSYLDIDTSEFSRYVNLTDNNRTWHDDFHYFGRNVYAYWLAKYGEYIDLVIVQFYESYSRAAMEVYNNSVTPENYLQQYVWNLNDRGQEFWVDFNSDPALKGI